MNSAVDNQMSQENKDAAEFVCSGETEDQECCESDCIHDLASSCQDLEMDQDSSGDQSSLNNSLYIPNNHMTKSMLCLNEESQDEVSHCSCISNLITVMSAAVTEFH